MDVNPHVWRLMGFGLSIIGFTCFALGSSSQKLFGRWNLLKIVLYCVFSSMFSLFMLSANRIRRRFPRVFLLKPIVSFLVMLFTSLYSYYDDRAGKDGETEGEGHRNIFSLISFGSFALTCMILSTQVRPGIEVGMSNFFLGCLVLGVMKKNFLEGLGVAVLCFMVMSIHYYSDFRREVELQHIVVVRGDSLEETQQIPSPLPLTIHPSSPSLSTLTRRPVKLDSPSLRRESQKLETRHEVSKILEQTDEIYKILERSGFSITPSLILPIRIDFKALRSVNLSPTECSTLLSSEEDLAIALRSRSIGVSMYGKKSHID